LISDINVEMVARNGPEDVTGTVKLGRELGVALEVG